jgi:hypothetical protein
MGTLYIPNDHGYEVGASIDDEDEMPTSDVTYDGVGYHVRDAVGES